MFLLYAFYYCKNVKILVFPVKYVGRLLLGVYVYKKCENILNSRNLCHAAAKEVEKQLSNAFKKTFH